MQKKYQHKKIRQRVVVFGVELIIETLISINVNGKLLNGHGSKKIKQINMAISNARTQINTTSTKKDEASFIKQNSI